MGSRKKNQPVAKCFKYHKSSDTLQFQINPSMLQTQSKIKMNWKRAGCSDFYCFLLLSLPHSSYQMLYLRVFITHFHRLVGPWRPRRYWPNEWIWTAEGSCMPGSPPAYHPMWPPAPIGPGLCLFCVPTPRCLGQFVPQMSFEWMNEQLDCHNAMGEILGALFLLPYSF